MSTELNLPLIRLLVVKDWQLFQKQLAAYVLGGIVALTLLGHAQPWSFYLGSLLLIVVLVAAACFAISTSLLAERKEQTLAFVMSLPVSPLDFTLAKLAGNLLTFGVPFLVMLLGTVLVILSTPLPNGLLVMALLIYGYILLAYCLSLAVAMQVESEGWNTFAMIGSMVLINPFIMLLGQIDAIREPTRGSVVVWSAEALGLLAALLLLSLALLGWIVWRQGRRGAFY
ncbi:MAG: ABC-2 transporter permease [Xanthomonadales bacterium]|jgi:ABC-type transport system involved in multi-copper enzyme maturation permease subunit|nr:ABC-2 transporter permease [Xanthomonadales bacterium]